MVECLRSGLQTRLCIEGLARWQNSHAEDCKSSYVGSIPARASKIDELSVRSLNRISPSLLKTRNFSATYGFGGLEPLHSVAYTQSMNRWKTILSVLIALWLPLQGYTAVAMPFCQHRMAPASTYGETADHSQHHHDGHSSHMTHADAPNDSAAISHANHVGSDNTGGLGCNNCGACHLACAPAISAVVPVYLSIGNAVLESAPADAPRFFYPEQLQRPPLSALL